MLALHFIFFSVLISSLDITIHKVRKKHVYWGLITVIPWVELSSFILSFTNFLLYLVIFFASGYRIGFGDVRLALLIGAYLGTKPMGIEGVFFSNLVSWISGSLLIVLRNLLKRSIMTGNIAFAPHMFVGAIITLALY